MMKKIYFGVILGLLVLGGVGIFVSGQRTFSETENRYLNRWSDVHSSADVEGVMVDQFAFRDQFLALHAGVEYARGMREINDTYTGKDGYLLAACAAWDLPMTSYVQNLSHLATFYKKYGVSMDVVLVPSPAIILADKLPMGANVYDADEAYTVAKELLGQGSLSSGADDAAARIRLYDLRGELTERMATTQVYYRNDHHWTTKGALVAYEALTGKSAPMTQVVTEEFYGTMYSRVPTPLAKADTIEAPMGAPLREERPVMDESFGSTLYDPQKLMTKDKYAYFLGGNSARADFDGAGTGRLLVIKDSYANCLVPFLLEEYAHITVLDLRFYNAPMAELMEEGYDQVLVLYEMSNFAKDSSIFKLGK